MAQDKFRPRTSAIIAKLQACLEQIPDAERAGQTSRGDATVRFLIGEIDNWLQLGGSATEYEQAQFISLEFGNRYVSDSFGDNETLYQEDWEMADRLVKSAIDKLKLQDSPTQPNARAVGKRIFIGHGGSADWKDLRDFLRDRLHLEYEEFNREPVAGRSNKERLLEMLENSCFAFIVMTAEDVTTDGKQHARENVIHELGLFQGRLTFERAIILLEKGCEEFANIEGVGQIRFERGRISDVSEKIREVLEREEIIPRRQ